MLQEVRGVNLLDRRGLEWKVGGVGVDRLHAPVNVHAEEAMLRDLATAHVEEFGDQSSPPLPPTTFPRISLMMRRSRSVNLSQSASANGRLFPSPPMI